MNGISAAPVISARPRSAAVLSQRAREAIALGALVSLILAGALFAASAAGGASFVVPASHAGLPTWMAMHGASTSGTSSTPGPSESRINRKSLQWSFESSRRTWVIGLGGQARMGTIIAFFTSLQKIPFRLQQRSCSCRLAYLELDTVSAI